jgi:phosphoglycolate phosphatase-like HAD superfamily hydrolase
VLFDLDGTLLSSGGAGRRAIQRALLETFGTSGPSDHWFDGKTDPQIVREMMHRAAVDAELVEARMQGLLARYVECLREDLATSDHGARALQGATELLDCLAARDDVMLGLLTGNVEEGARAKLGAVGIESTRFRVGAFGSDHALRPELPAIARERAEKVLGRDVPGHAVVVVGDTPADLTCGRGIGARAVGVATGRYSVGDLAEYDAVAVFKDLTDTPAVVAALLGD